MRRLSGILFAICLAGAPGCVQRELVITSDPPGADVVVNQRHHGKTPYHLPFKHYGTYDIRLTHPGYTDGGGNSVRYYPLQVAEPVVAPVYQKMGVDFVAEALVPATITDRRELHYTLEPIGTADNMKDILDRADALRHEGEQQAMLRAAKDANRQPISLPLPLKRPPAGGQADVDVSDAAVAYPVDGFVIPLSDPTFSYPPGTVFTADGVVVSGPSFMDVPDATPPSPDRLPIF